MYHGIRNKLRRLKTTKNCRFHAKKFLELVGHRKCSGSFCCFFHFFFVFLPSLCRKVMRRLYSNYTLLKQKAVTTLTCESCPCVYLHLHWCSTSTTMGSTYSTSGSITVLVAYIVSSEEIIITLLTQVLTHSQGYTRVAL